MATDQQKSRTVQRALVSVSDKTGLRALVEYLAENAVDILSTGGTAKTIRSWGIPVQETSELTGFAALLGGRVKSLHPALHASILAQPDCADDLAELAALGLVPINLLVVNFYPFPSHPITAHDTGPVEFIDIGGPALVRAAAKNHDSVTVVTSPKEYPALLAELGDACATSPGYRRQCAVRAFARTSAYDSQIAAWLQPFDGNPDHEHFALTGRNGKCLAYGENPHQTAMVFSTDPVAGLANAHQHCGKPLGYNNLLDADAAGTLAAAFDAKSTAACVIVKHGSPCGVATSGKLAEAFASAWDCDPLSAFGGVIAVNRPLDTDTAALISRQFVEVILAPAIMPEAMTALKARPGVRLLTGNLSTVPPAQELRSIRGGLLVQEYDDKSIDQATFRTVTEVQPTEQHVADLGFAMQVAHSAKSNAVVIAKNGATLGIGSGQTSRVAAACMATTTRDRYHRQCPSPVAASDGFFPFPDGVEQLAVAGVAAIAQPGGSRNDADVIAAANRLGVAMVLTGRRCFRH
ncbi:MAG: bifunctional phosphoribosylaminoimidazolecarboxamide formyltransferase/IMP cyclohydrolase [Rhodobacteraceae bacterium]|nr:bifunctional phosphoribosylaminoimidazolecarboxamide formyltransferase/IMP cyclohydrolase [Paracoccaceae bacterium]